MCIIVAIVIILLVIPLTVVILCQTPTFSSAPLTPILSIHLFTIIGSTRLTYLVGIHVGVPGIKGIAGARGG